MSTGRDKGKNMAGMQHGSRITEKALACSPECRKGTRGKAVGQDEAAVSRADI